jgi:hypothetical protein
MQAGNAASDIRHFYEELTPDHVSHRVWVNPHTRAKFVAFDPCFQGEFPAVFSVYEAPAIAYLTRTLF